MRQILIATLGSETKSPKCTAKEPAEALTKRTKRMKLSSIPKKAPSKCRPCKKISIFYNDANKMVELNPLAFAKITELATFWVSLYSLYWEN